METQLYKYWFYGFLIVGLIVALVLIIMWREGKI